MLQFVINSGSFFKDTSGTEIQVYYRALNWREVFVELYAAVWALTLGSLRYKMALQYLGQKQSQ